MGVIINHQAMGNYHEIVRKLTELPAHPNRTGVPASTMFFETLEFDLRDGFPLLTTKSIPLKSFIAELCWFITGSTSVHDLKKLGSNIWDEWAREDGGLGPIYGAQWRGNYASSTTGLADVGVTTYEHAVRNLANISNEIGAPNFDSVAKTEKKKDSAVPLLKRNNGNDQLVNIINNLVLDPRSRRHVISSWNPTYIPEYEGTTTTPSIDRMALPPCHMSMQFYVEPGTNVLHLRWDQRSADVFLGLPFNIASYALLLTLVAAHCGYTAGKLHCTLGDVHLYDNHREQAKELLVRYHERNDHSTPKFDADNWLVKNCLSLIIETRERFIPVFGESTVDSLSKLFTYSSEGAIKAPIAV